MVFSDRLVAGGPSHLAVYDPHRLLDDRLPRSKYRLSKAGQVHQASMLLFIHENEILTFRMRTPELVTRSAPIRESAPYI